MEKFESPLYNSHRRYDYTAIIVFFFFFFFFWSSFVNGARASRKWYFRYVANEIFSSLKNIYKRIYITGTTNSVFFFFSFS